MRASSLEAFCYPGFQPFDEKFLNELFVVVGFDLSSEQSPRFGAAFPNRCRLSRPAIRSLFLRVGSLNQQIACLHRFAELRTRASFLESS
jgi:hypothetical protein